MQVSSLHRAQIFCFLCEIFTTCSMELYRTLRWHFFIYSPACKMIWCLSCSHLTYAGYTIPLNWRLHIYINIYIIIYINRAHLCRKQHFPPKHDHLCMRFQEAEQGSPLFRATHSPEKHTPTWTDWSLARSLEYTWREIGSNGICKSLAEDTDCKFTLVFVNCN